MPSLTLSAAALPVLLLTAATAAAADESRIACWEGDLAACEAGVAANPDDLYWLAQATWAYDNAGDVEHADPLRGALSREVREIAVVREALERLAQQELTEGSPQLAIDAFTVLADYGDQIAVIAHINQTGGSPYPPDGLTRQVMEDVAGQVRGDALEGRGIAYLLAGDADAAIADLRAALEYGGLRETLRFLRDRGIDYQGENRFTIVAIDDELEALLRGLATPQAMP